MIILKELLALRETVQRFKIDLDYAPEDVDWDQPADKLEKELILSAKGFVKGIDLATFSTDPEARKAIMNMSDVEVQVVTLDGPGGGNPLMRFIGSKDDLIGIIKKYYDEDDEMIDVEISQIKPV